jgi:four helix bundle protein
VWKRSITFVTQIYSATSTFPKHELYSLVSQLRRAAVSVPSNISEGAARKNTTEYRQFLYIALGSLSELETQLIICRNLDYLSSSDFEFLLAERDTIAKMIIKLKQTME